MAINIAKLSYTVKKEVDGTITAEQTTEIAKLLEEYKRHAKNPKISDYQNLRNKREGYVVNKRHESDYYLFDEDENKHYLIELKIGGDLDNKKARSEKEALLEQFAILSNTLNKAENIHIHFATAYNRYGEGNEWKQMRVRQYFAEEELLISKDFWDFICQSNKGYEIVLDEYERCASFIKDALKDIKNSYLE
jgi:hypothetical protein